jgi:hypothetical protein
MCYNGLMAFENIFAITYLLNFEESKKDRQHKGHKIPKG